MRSPDMEPENTPWGAGCLAYDRTRYAIVKQSAIEPWLRIVDSGMCFVFSIGVVPVRFYRGEPDEPTERTLAQNFPELAQMKFAFPKQVEDERLLWRFAVETQVDGTVANIAFVGVDPDGDVVCRWDWNQDQSNVVPISAATPRKPGGKELAAPPVEPKNTGKEGDVSTEET